MKKINKILAVLFAAVIMMTAMSVSSFAYGMEDAEEIVLDDTVKGELSKQSETDYYKIKISQKGTLTLDFSTQIRATYWSLFDEDGAYVEIKSLKTKAGETSANSGDETFRVVENSASGKATGTVTYKVNKGTYFVAVQNDNPYGGKTYSFTPSFTKDNAKVFSYFGITMKKGSTMQLEAVDANSNDTTWKSSKKTVVTVSSSGKLTAKKKGTSIITCTSGDTSVKLKVTVK